jgi:hypothetical protein
MHWKVHQKVTWAGKGQAGFMKLGRRQALIGAMAATSAIGGYWIGMKRGTPDSARLATGPRVAANTPAMDAPTQALRVFHLGHSLVGRDMPAFVTQLAHAAGYSGHRHESQLGWGAPLRDHWYPDIEPAGFETENAHPHFRPARDAVESGDYDAIILTEMVELRDAIRWHGSAEYLHRWTALARAARRDVRVYLYESWHDLLHPEGFINRLDRDGPELWEGTLLARVWSDPSAGPAHLIPAGRVIAALLRKIDQDGALPGLSDASDLFARNPDGSQDTIHLNDQGNYLVALTHLAVLYQRPVAGLPFALQRADGSAALPPSAAVAELMQRIAWETVSTLPVTGIALEVPV